MAIINSLAVGKARKSAGNLTFATIKGRTIAREKSAYVRNPQTPAQRAQRGRMAVVVAAWRQYGSQAKKLFTITSKYGSAYNQFVSDNIALYDGSELNPATGIVSLQQNTVFGKGKYNPSEIEMEMDASDNIIIKNASQEIKDELKVGDVFGMLGYDVNTHEFSVFEIVLTEAQVQNIKNGTSVSVPYTGVPANMYGFFFYSPSRNVSTSVSMQ